MLRFSRLYRRNHTFYIRVKIPESLQPIAHKSEIKYSLRTNNYWEALALLRKESYKADLIIQQYRELNMLIKDHNLTIDDKDIDKLVIHRLKQLDEIFELHFDDLLCKSFDKESIKLFPEKEFKEKKQENATYTRQEFEFDCIEKYFNNYIAEIKDDSRTHISTARQAERIQGENIPLIADRGNINTMQTKLVSALKGTEKFAIDKMECIENDIDFNKGINPRVRHCLKAIDEERNQQALAKTQSKTEWKVVFDEMCQHKRNTKNTTENSLLQSERYLQTIFEIIGKKYIESITYKDCHKVSDIIFNLPKQWRRRNKAKEANLNEVLSHPNDDKISASNARKYLRHFKELMMFAKKRRYISESFADDIDIPKAKNQIIVDGFSPDELKMIFNPKTYPKKNAILKSHCFWVPLIALFSGMRLNEICQLYVDDIKYQNGYYCFFLTDERKDQHLKNPQSKRCVPVHPMLIKMGFIEYVKALRKDKKKRVFYLLEYSEEKYYRSVMSHWFNRYLTKINITGRNKVFHSFRHTVKPYLRDAGISQEYQNAICGWVARDIGERVYGGEVPIKKLFEEISKLQYPFLEENLLKIGGLNKN